MQRKARQRARSARADWWLLVRVRFKCINSYLVHVIDASRQILLQRFTLLFSSKLAPCFTLQAVPRAFRARWVASRPLLAV